MQQEYMLVNNIDVLEQIAELVGHLAWPVTTIILLLLIRQQMNAMLTALSERMKNPGSEIKLGPGGVSISSARAGKTETGNKIATKIKSDPALLEQLTVWLKIEKPGLEVTDLIYLGE